MKYHQILNKISGKKNEQILDWAFEEATYFSLVWREGFKFKARAKKIEEKLEIYLLKTELTSEWPGTKVYGPPENKICFYKVKKKTEKIIKNTGSIFQWVAPKYPEDLAFYNNKLKPIFGSVAHEKLAFIIGKKKVLRSAEEVITDLKIKIIKLNT